MIEWVEFPVEVWPVPKYDYRCSACSNLYEKREGFDAPSVQECPQCGGQARRVLTPPAIVFKGSGWYITDSRNGRSASTDSPASTSTTDTKSESTTSDSTSTASSTSEAAAAD
jgi:putative FmdB family regulatory protein